MNQLDDYLNREPTRYVGNLSSAPLERSILLSCYDCMISWTGCQDAAECPQCGSTSSYEEHLALQSELQAKHSCSGEIQPS
jgi:hypothetical protein